MPLRYHLWYNAQDRSFYETYHNSFDGYAVNAHILAHNAKAFLTMQLQTEDHPKPFFILPDIHALQFYSRDQFDNEKGSMRSSWSKLQQAYGDKTRQVIGEHRPITPGDLSATSEIDKFCSSVIEFQRSALVAPFQALARLLPANTLPPRPEFLVAPYFFFENRADPWYVVAIRAAQSAAKFKQSDRVFAVIFCSKDCLTPSDIGAIVTGFNQDGIDGFLLWIDDFDERRESEQLLDGVKSLVYSLSQSGKRVWILYGGHFASLLSYYGLNGYASAICTRDKMSARPPPPIRGPAGGPVPRYYIPRLHSKLVQEDARRLLAEFPDLACNCSLCTSRTIVNIPALDPNSRWSLRQLMREHFLLVRKDQLDQLNSQSPQASFGELAQTASATGQSPLFDSTFLRRWHRVLSGSITQQ